MADPGLETRLRQRGRRSGLMVGITMALAIALGLGGFIVLYAKIDPYLSDFVGSRPAPLQAAPSSVAQAGQPPAIPTPVPTPTPAPTATPPPTPTPNVFKATNLSNTTARVQLRPQPSLQSEPPVTVLDPSTPLQALGDQSTDSDGTLWIKVRTQDNQVGWVRVISTVPITQGQ